MCKKCPKQKKALTFLIAVIVAFIGFSIAFTSDKPSAVVKPVK